MRIAIITVTKGGRETGARIKEALKEHDVALYGKKEYIAEGDEELRHPIGEFVGALVKSFEALVFVTATGVAVRAVAKHMKEKHADPAVVVVDERAKHVISLLSGHHGANALTREIASRIGAEAVITTSTEVQGKMSVEGLAEKLNSAIDDYRDVKAVNAAIANDIAVDVFSEVELNLELPDLSLKPWAALRESRNPKVVITNKLLEVEGPTVLLRPKNLILGLGARRGIDKERLLEAVREGLKASKLSIKSVKALATIEARAREKGFIEAAKALGVPLVGISREAIREVEGEYHSSDYVKEKIGVGAVCEPCAALAGDNASVIVGKTKFKGITLAVAEEKGLGTSQHSGSQLRKARWRSAEKGKIYLIGIGPGGREYITPRAVEALEEAEVIVSYKGYLPYISEYITGKEVIARGMGGEVERAKKALKKAGEGGIVAVVSSGDPGVYAMASVVLECAREAGVKPDIEVVPGITAASAASALLGAPLGHDFAVVSLSDLLTPWGVIEKRLEEAAKGDFCIVLYNPRSRSRREHLRRAVEILKKYRRPSTPAGIVRHAMRQGEEVIVTTLGELLRHEVDMHSTIIVGNSESFVHNSWVVTPRGYRGKYFEEMK
jgi:cobalt-precorrin 5A hydrolase/precorrin-3B C17-methyltransferase